MRKAIAGRLAGTGKVVSNSLGNLAGMMLQSIMQLVSVPVLIGLWDARSYGLWLMLTTIPAYFSLSDFGFLQAAFSDMTMAIARGERARARIVFHSVAALMAVSSLLLAALAAGGLLLPPLLFDLAGWWPAQAPLIALMTAYAALVLFSRVAPVGLRSSGHYGLGTLLYDSLTFVESCGVLLVAWFGGGPIDCTLALIAGRVVSIIVQAAVLGAVVPWLRMGFGGAEMSVLRRLLAPAVGAMAIPAGIVLNLQGMVVVTGALLSPVAVAVFVPVRTLSRVALQLIGIVNRATMPEYASAAASGDQRARRRLVRINALLVVAILLPATLGFALLGAPLVALWTGGRIAAPPLFVAGMAAAMLLHGLWYFGSNLLMATNAHVRFSHVPLIASTLGIVLALVLGRPGGLTGIALAVLATEIVNCAAMLPALRRPRAPQSAARAPA